MAQQILILNTRIGFMNIRIRFWRQFTIIAVVSIGINFLSACSPLIQISAKQNHVPHLNPAQFIASDGIRLPVKKWMPIERPVAVLVALHGFNDYSNGFAWPAGFLAEHGIATIAYDQRGFGQSPQHGIWPAPAILIQDALEITRLVKNEYPDVPVYLMGYSMGGAVALSAAVMTEMDTIEGLILIAPAVWGGTSFNSLYRGMLWLGAHIARGLTVSRLGSITLSDNREMLNELHADPNVITDTRLDAVYGITNLMDHAQVIAAENNKPVYIFYGLKDEVIPIEAICLLLSKLTAPFDVTFYADGYHFLLRDLNRKQVWLDILDKINSEDSLLSTIPEQCSELPG